MTLKTRKILFLICFLIFIAGTPILVGYAFGYRYNLENNCLIKTGAFLIKTQPSEVDIYLDGLLQDNKMMITPKGLIDKFIIITGLEPKNYLLEVKLENYHLWKKNLKIKEGLVTKINDIVLLLKNPEIISLNSERKEAIEIFFISPDKSKLIYLTKQTEETKERIYLIDLKNNKKINLSKNFLLESENMYPRLQIKQTKFIWSLDSEKIFFSGKIENTEYWFVFNIQEPEKLINLTKIFQTSYQNKIYDFKNLTWHPDNNSIFCLINDKLYQVDYQAKKLSEIAKDPISAYIIFQNSVYYLEKKTAIIYKTDLRGKSKKQINLTRMETKDLLPNTRLIISDEEKIAVLNNHTLYLLNQNDQPILISENVKGAEFFPNSSNLLWFTPSEIYVWQSNIQLENENGGDSQLITRYSKKIKKAVWASDSNHIFFIVDKKIKFIETDDRDQKNVFDFIELKSEDGDLFYDSKNKKLYFLDGEIYWTDLSDSF